MSCHFEVEPIEDRGEFSFQNLRLFHRECGGGAVTLRRNPASNEISARCVCGLEVTFVAGDAGPAEILKTAISGVASEIRSDLYHPTAWPAICVEQRT